MGKKEELKGGKGNKAEASKESHGKKIIIINWTLKKNKYGSKDSPVPDRFLKSQNYSSLKQKTQDINLKNVEFLALQSTTAA